MNGLSGALQDLRYAFRQMKRNPGFTVIAVLTLGLGIGANTAVFTIVNTILFKPLPYNDPDRLVRIIENVPAAESNTGAALRTTSMSPASFEEWRSKTKTLSGMALEMRISATLGGAQAVRLSGLRASPALFSLLGAQPFLGRIFDSSEEKAGADNVVVLSERAWTRHLAADAAILGKTVTLNDAAYTVVGVMPSGFAYPDSEVDFWMPLALPQPNVFGLPVIARLKDGVPIAEAEREAGAIGRELRGESENDPQPPGPPRIQLMTIQDELVAPIRRPFIVFVVAVTFVLLIACTNVANLFLARGASRYREIAIRIAIGARGARVLRQLITETLLLTFIGGIVGTALAAAGGRLFVALGRTLGRMDLMRFELAGNAIPRLDEVAVDLRALIFTLALTLVSGLLFGLIPAIQIRRIRASVPSGLHFAAPWNPGRRLLRRVLVVGQIGLTMVLLLGAGLLIKSFVKLADAELGYSTAGVLTFKVPQPALEYPRDAQRQIQQNAFAEALAGRLASLPDVDAAAFTNELPMVQGYFSWVDRARPPAQRADGRISIVSRDYFRTMGIPLLSGRSFEPADLQSKRAVYLVNQAAVRDYYGGASPIGKTVSGGGFGPGEIVGIVGDIRQAGLAAEPAPQLFMAPQHLDAVYGGGYYFVVKSRKDPATLVPFIRDAVHDLSAQLVVDDIATMDAIVANSITAPRSYAVLLGAFSAAALALAVIGLYGLLNYLVKQRTQEIGIRMAVGAQQRQIMLLVLRHGVVLTVCGLIVGIGGGAALTRYLQSMLVGVAPLDRGTFVVVGVVFAVVALAASFVPARRAMRIDPLTALREHER